MSVVDLQQIKIFLTAAEEQSFTAAAKKLHMSQSSVSQHIHALELKYGVDLFIRRGKSVVLSEAGANICSTARELIRSATLLEDHLQSVNSQVGGDLMIGCSTSAGKYLLPCLLSNFQKDYPAVHPRVKIMDRNDVLQRLLTDQLPMGVMSKQVEHSMIESEALFEDHMVLIVPPHHPWAEYGTATPDDLLDQKMIVREETAGTSESFISGLKSYGITRDMLNVVMELGNPEAIEMAVELGMGIAFISELVAARGLALKRVRKVVVQGLDLHRKIYIARHIGFPFTRAQSLFWDYSLAQRNLINGAIWNTLTDFDRVNAHLINDPSG